MAAFDFNQLLSELGKWRRPAGAMPIMGMGAGNFGGGKGPTNMQMPQMQPPQLLGPGNSLNIPMHFNLPSMPSAAPATQVAAASGINPLTGKPFPITRATNPGDYGR